MPHITTRSAPTERWARMRRLGGLCSTPVSLSPNQYYPACTITMSGYDFRKGQAHLRRTVGAFAAYYNESRVHRSLNKDAPFHRAIDRLGAITARPVLSGLHHQYGRI